MINVKQQDDFKGPAGSTLVSDVLKSNETLWVSWQSVSSPRDRASLVDTAGALAWREDVSRVGLERRGDSVALSITFRDAESLQEWLTQTDGMDVVPQLKTPPFWKRWVLSMVAVYPALLLLVLLMQPLTEGMHAAASLFLVAFLLTGLSTGLVSPFLNRRFLRWLHAS